MRLHCVGLPHTELIAETSWCAYTQKVRRFSPMMMAQGFDVILYGGTRCDVECTEHVELITNEERDLWWGEVDWDTSTFGGWEPSAPWWRVQCGRAIAEIAKRIEPGDIICIVAGVCHQPIVDAFKDTHAVTEPWVGYSGITADFCAFESYCWMHTTYAKQGWNQGRAYDQVVANFYDVSDFDATLDRGDFLLYLGRLNLDKGVEEAAMVAEATGLTLVAAGQGDPSAFGREVDFRGVVQPEERRELLGRARALVMATRYVEPLGGSHIEAQLSGCPAITTDWGVFNETNMHGFSGWRCRTLGEMIEGVERLDELASTAEIAERARGLWSVDEIGPLFASWFDRIGGLRGGADWNSWTDSRFTTRYGARR